MRSNNPCGNTTEEHNLVITQLSEVRMVQIQQNTEIAYLKQAVAENRQDYKDSQKYTIEIVGNIGKKLDDYQTSTDKKIDQYRAEMSSEIYTLRTDFITAIEKTQQMFAAAIENNTKIITAMHEDMTKSKIETMTKGAEIQEGVQRKGNTVVVWVAGILFIYFGVITGLMIFLLNAHKESESNGKPQGLGLPQKIREIIFEHERRNTENNKGKTNCNTVSYNFIVPERYRINSRIYQFEMGEGSQKRIN